MPYARVVGNPPPDADGIKLLSPRVQCWKLHNTVGCRPCADCRHTEASMAFPELTGPLQVDVYRGVPIGRPSHRSVTM